MYAPELETLDQLVGGDMPLAVIAKLYSSPEAFQTGIEGLLLSCGDVLLLDTEGNAVPAWRWREVFDLSSGEQVGQFQLRLTPQGAKRIG